MKSGADTDSATKVLVTHKVEFRVIAYSDKTYALWLLSHANNPVCPGS